VNVARDNSALVSSLFVYQATASTIVSDTPCRLNQSASSMPCTTSGPPSLGQSHLPFSSLPPSVIAPGATHEISLACRTLMYDDAPSRLWGGRACRSRSWDGILLRSRTRAAPARSGLTHDIAQVAQPGLV